MSESISTLARYERLVARGYGELDHSALHRLLLEQRLSDGQPVAAITAPQHTTGEL